MPADRPPPASPPRCTDWRTWPERARSTARRCPTLRRSPRATRAKRQPRCQLVQGSCQGLRRLEDDALPVEPVTGDHEQDMLARSQQARAEQLRKVDDVVRGDDVSDVGKRRLPYPRVIDADQPGED